MTTLPFQKASLALLFTGLMALLQGCGQGASSAPSQRAPEPVAQTITLNVAAAADLKYALDALIAEFGKTHPTVKLQTTYGSSGKLYEQLQNQAPFDLYFSADIEYARKLVKEKLASPDSQFTYGFGQMVLWVPTDSPLDLERHGLHALLDPSVAKVAIANPAHAPYGRAAEAALKNLDFYDQVQPKLVLGDNIAQAAQFVESGAADAGILALSLAMAPALADKGRYIVVPDESYPPLEQAGVILQSSQHAEQAWAFRAFVLSDAGLATLQKFGFQSPKD